jgi:hypothetical protein
MPGIQSQQVVLVEGDANVIAPNAKLAADMHGYVIMVPPGEGGERLLDMLWRITMAYAGMPRLLRGRATVSKMVEAVWSNERREPKPAPRPKRKGGLTHLTAAKTESLPDPKRSSKAKTRRKN